MFLIISFEAGTSNGDVSILYDMTCSAYSLDGLTSINSRMIFILTIFVMVPLIPTTRVPGTFLIKTQYW